MTHYHYYKIGSDDYIEFTPQIIQQLPKIYSIPHDAMEYHPPKSGYPVYKGVANDYHIYFDTGDRVYFKRKTK